MFKLVRIVLILMFFLCILLGALQLVHTVH